MILSDKDIKRHLDSGDIIINPFSLEFLGPASVDLHLDRHFLVFETRGHYVIDPKKPVDDMMRQVEINDNEPFVIHPGGFALGLIYEETGVSEKLAGRLEGKSSVGRLGLIIHTTAGFLDPGNSLKMTLELHNTSELPILLYYKMPIAQMAFEQLSSPCQTPYSSKKTSKYIADDKPKASQMWKNFQ